jgi:hypothetical protein
MIAIVILNAVLVTIVLVAVLSLLGWGIVTDRAWASTRPFQGRGGRTRRRRLGRRPLRFAFERTQLARDRR